MVANTLDRTHTAPTRLLAETVDSVSMVRTRHWKPYGCLRYSILGSSCIKARGQVLR